MRFANYTEFRIAVLKMIEGTDQVTNSMSADTLDLLIALGETYVYRGPPGLRVDTMHHAFFYPIKNRAVEIPGECLALKTMWIDDGRPLTPVAEDQLQGSGGMYRSNIPLHYAVRGTTILLPEGVQDGQVLNGHYYIRPPDLRDAASHLTFQKYPEVFLFAALAKSAPFIGDDERIPMWEQQYKIFVDAANTLTRNLGYSGAPLRQRVR